MKGAKAPSATQRQPCGLRTVKTNAAIQSTRIAQIARLIAAVSLWKCVSRAITSAA